REAALDSRARAPALTRDASGAHRPTSPAPCPDGPSHFRIRPLPGGLPWHPSRHVAGPRDLLARVDRARCALRRPLRDGRDVDAHLLPPGLPGPTAGAAERALLRLA